MTTKVDIKRNSNRIRRFISETLCTLGRSDVAVMLCAYASITSALAFFHGALFENNQADLIALFQHQPLVWCVLAPLIWTAVEEVKQDGLTISKREQFGKALTLGATALILTTPLWLTINWLGRPDNLMILSGYIGTIALIATMMALSMVISRTIGKGTKACMTSIVLCMGLTLLGDESLLMVLQPWPTLSKMAELFSISTHYHAMVIGLLKPQNAVYFGMSIYCLATICSQPRSRSPYARLERNARFLLIGCGAIVFSNQLTYRLDLTGERIYSLSDKSKRIIDDVSHSVDIRLYKSITTSKSHPRLAIHLNRVEALMKEIEQHSDGKISLQVIDTPPNSHEEWEAAELGIAPIGIDTNHTYLLGSILFSGEQEISIPFFSIKREQQLEFDIIQSILRILNKEKPTIGILNGNTDLNSTESKDWEILSVLNSRFDLKDIGSTETKIDDKIDCLILIQPNRLNEVMRYHIDQYLMQNRPVIIAIDPFLRTNSKDNITDFLDHYHIHVSRNVVADEQLKTRIDLNGTPFPHPGLLSLNSDQANKKHPLSSQIANILLAEAGEVSQINDSPLTMTPLLSSSSTAQTVDPKTLLGGAKGIVSFTESIKGPRLKRTISALFTGPLSSAFSQTPMWANQKEHRTDGMGNARIMVIADVDFLANRNSLNKNGKTRNDNWAYFINSIDILSQDNRLLDIESKSVLNRPFAINEAKNERIKELLRNPDPLSRERVLTMEKKGVRKGLILKAIHIFIWPLLALWLLTRAAKWRKEGGWA